MRLGAAAVVGLMATAAGGAASAQEISFMSRAPASGALAVPVTESGALVASGVDATAASAIAAAIKSADFKGEKGKTLTLYNVGAYGRVHLIGIGAGPVSETDLEDFGGMAAKAAKEGAAGPLAAFAPDAPAIQADAAHAAFGAALGSYRFAKLGAGNAPEPARPLIFVTPDASAADTLYKRDWAAVAEGVTLARDLISTPSNLKPPEVIAARAQAAFRGVANTRVEVLAPEQMRQLGMGAILGVGQGSTRGPRMVVVRYQGAAASEAPLAFVGKGITFDSGGISLKPGDGMWRMRYDMSGGAAAIGAVLALAKRGAKVNAVAVGAFAENMPDGGAIRPGDVLTTASGRTIEVLNTDAEGRLVLTDGVWYAQEQFKPRAVITIATLTGAVRTALGDDYAGLFANDDKLAEQVQQAAARSGEHVWRLPIHESIKADLKSDVADVKNVIEASGQPGASIGAAFIQGWIREGQPWAHLDIAGMAWETDGEHTVPKGAAGYGVRLFDRLARLHETQ